MRRNRILGIVLLFFLTLFVLVLLGGKREGRLRQWLERNRQGGETPTGQSPVEVKGERLVRRVSILVDKVGGRVDWSHKNDVIAFSKFGEDGNADIYTMRPDGSDQVCLTCDKSEIPQLSNDQPEWHPGGEYIVFESLDPNLKGLPKFLTEGGAGLNNNLWVVSFDGTKFYQLTHVKTGEASLHPHFSHDGKKLFWAARVVPAGLGSGYWALKTADFVIDASGARISNEREYRPIEGFGFYESHSFSVDDKTVFFSASKSQTNFDLDIYSLDLSSGQVKNLTNTPGVWDEHSILSPSGKKIGWISSNGYPFTPGINWGTTLKTDYWLANIDGSQKQKITFFNESGYPESQGARVILADSSWNKKGDKIVVASHVDGVGTRIWLIEFKKPQ